MDRAQVHNWTLLSYISDGMKALIFKERERKTVSHMSLVKSVVYKRKEQKILYSWQRGGNEYWIQNDTAVVTGKLVYTMCAKTEA